jgi:cell pole-organizing protein PopZ
MSGATPGRPAFAKAGPGSAAADASMDDILASIRRILNDEVAPPDTQGGQTMEKPDPVLQLDPAMMVPAPVSSGALPPAPSGPAQSGPAQSGPAQSGPAQSGPAQSGPVPPASAGIVAPEAAAAAAQAVGSLVRTLAAERAMQVHSNGPTIEDIVRAEIRPILKHWLDTNLPPMVERLVRAEIERVVGRAVP